MKVWMGISSINGGCSTATLITGGYINQQKNRVITCYKLLLYKDPLLSFASILHSLSIWKARNSVSRTWTSASLGVFSIHQHKPILLCISSCDYLTTCQNKHLTTQLHPHPPLVLTLAWKSWRNFWGANLVWHPFDDRWASLGPTTSQLQCSWEVTSSSAAEAVVELRPGDAASQQVRCVNDR